jgi:hypothetical protein
LTCEKSKKAERDQVNFEFADEMSTPVPHGVSNVNLFSISKEKGGDLQKTLDWGETGGQWAYGT